MYTNVDVDKVVYEPNDNYFLKLVKKQWFHIEIARVNTDDINSVFLADFQND